MLLNESYPITSGLCPPIGTELRIKGKSSSKDFVKLKIELKQCNYTQDSTCANSTYFTQKMNELKRFLLNVPVIQPNLNPSKIEYKNFFFDDRQCLLFDKDTGIFA